MTPEAVRDALRAGPATLDGLRARLGAPDRDALAWAVDEAMARGWVTGGDGEECGVCSSAAPTVLRLREP